MATYASKTYDTVRGIIADRCEICTPETLTPEAHLKDDLGIDSLDLLEIKFELEKAFHIKMPDNYPCLVGDLCAFVDLKVTQTPVAA